MKRLPAETFRCDVFRSTITRAACAERHRLYAGKGQGAHNRPEQLGITSCACRHCPIGIEHARGQRPDVPLVAVAVHPSSARPRITRCLGCGEPFRRWGPARSRRSKFCSNSCESVIEELRNRELATQLPERW